jgi:hypothetical protein
VTVPALEDLMAEMDLDTHAGRVRRVSLLGRDEAGSAGLVTLLDQLTELGGYWHCLALRAAVAARDGQRVLAALRSPSRQVRSFAFNRAVTAGVDIEELLPSYERASTAERAVLARLVGSAGRPDVAERLVAWCRATERDDEAARLLWACRAEVVAAALPDLDHAVRSWTSLGRRHPGVVLDHIEARLHGATRRRRDDLWRSMGAGVRAATPAEPERVLALLEELGPTTGPAHVLHDRLGLLVRRFPARTTTLLLRREHISSLRRGGIPHAVLTHARSLPERERLALATAVRDSPRHVAMFLRRLPPAERGPLFRATHATVDTTGELWPNELLEVLPAGVRAVEVRRMLARREVAEDPDRTLATSSFLPVEETRALFDAVLRSNRPEDRAMAYGLLIDCTRRRRSAAEVGTTLTTLGRLRNEQDPVRLAAVVALGRIPAHLFTDEHLGELIHLIKVVVEARDSSAATVGHLRLLALRLLQHLPADAPRGRLDAILTALDLLAGPSGTLAFGEVGRSLPRRAEEKLLAALLPRLLEDARGDRFGLALSLASGLGRRAWPLDALQDLVGRATRAPHDSVARKAIDLWLAAPATRSDRVGALVGTDPSTLTLAPVLRVVTMRRQDLLDVVLRPDPIRGRFLTGSIRWVPVILEGLDRWLPRQLDGYADALDQLIRDSRLEPWRQAAALQAMARLPLIGAVRLERYLADASIPVVEAALGGLAWTDQPERHLGRLLAFADGDRARVAVYAASRCARFTAPQALGEQLRAVLHSPSSKVTARKEAVRLLALHQAADALDVIGDVAEQPEQHRDVRIAVGRSVRAFLDQPRAWRVLESLTAATADEAASVLETAPAAIPDRHRPAFARLVISVTAHPDRRCKMTALGQLAAWSPWSAAAAPIAAGAVEDLTSGPSWRDGLRSLVLIFADGAAGDVTVRLVRTLGAAQDPPETDAGDERDRPAQQRLSALIGELSGIDAAARGLVGDDLLACAAALSSDPGRLHAEIHLLLSAADPTNLVGPVSAMVGRLTDRPLAGMAAAAALAARLDRDRSRWEPADLDEVADHLISDASPGALLLAIAVIGQAGRRSGWSAMWRDRLRTVRATPDPDIAAGALAIHTAPE